MVHLDGRLDFGDHAGGVSKARTSTDFPDTRGVYRLDTTNCPQCRRKSAVADRTIVCGAPDPNTCFSAKTTNCGVAVRRHRGAGSPLRARRSRHRGAVPLLARLGIEVGDLAPARGLSPALS